MEQLGRPLRVPSDLAAEDKMARVLFAYEEGPPHVSDTQWLLYLKSVFGTERYDKWASGNR